MIGVKTAHQVSPYEVELPARGGRVVLSGPRAWRRVERPLSKLTGRFPEHGGPLRSPESRENGVGTYVIMYPEIGCV